MTPRSANLRISRSQFLHLCRQLEACVQTPAAAQITVSAVHKAKGLEACDLQRFNLQGASASRAVCLGGRVLDRVPEMTKSAPEREHSSPSVA